MGEPSRNYAYYKHLLSSYACETLEKWQEKRIAADRHAMGAYRGQYQSQSESDCERSHWRL
jgi:hypothetical protein